MMDFQQVLAVRKQLQEGQPVPVETLQACVSFLQDGRMNAKPATKKQPKSTEPKKSGEDLLRQLGF